jgi:hypothetical protein
MNITIAGTGFPTNNFNGNSNTVTVAYQSGSAENSTTVSPDNNGNFSVVVQVPSGAAIPSTNTIIASYDLYTPNTSSSKQGTVNTHSISHEVPSASLSINPSSGSAGDAIGITGTGFKRYTTITSVTLGGVDATPFNPKPTTDTNGSISFEIIVPNGLPAGTQTATLEIGGTTSLTTFTVAAP